MKFMCNTKPLVDSVSMAVINSNVSNFYKKSCILQLTCENDTLFVNVESQNICTEIMLSGKSDGEKSTVFVDSIKFKNLLNTLDSNSLTLEFESWGLTIRSGKSKFTLPKVIDDGEFELNRPNNGDVESDYIEFNVEDWKFVQNRQLYAIATTFINPVYTNVWVGEDGDCITGDMDTGLFTHATINGIGVTCLLSDTIVRLFTSLPENSKFIGIGNGSYLIESKNEGYTYKTEFTPLYESNENVGEYNSNIFLSMMEHPSDFTNVDTSFLSKSLNQATLLSTSSTDVITFKVDGNNVALIDTNIQSILDCNGSSDLKYEIEFRLSLLKKVISNYDGEVCISPIYQENDVVGILVWDDYVTTILSGIE